MNIALKSTWCSVVHRALSFFNITAQLPPIHEMLATIFSDKRLPEEPPRKKSAETKPTSSTAASWYTAKGGATKASQRKYVMC